MSRVSIPDYYARLGLRPQAEETEIKARYRALARRYHPDTNPSPSAQEAFQAIQEAYDHLSDSEARARYHRECALCGKTWALDPGAELDPAALAYEFSQLGRRLGTLGPQRMTNAEFQQHVVQRFTPPLCDLLQAHPQEEHRRDLIRVLFTGSSSLRYEDWIPVEAALLRLAKGEADWEQKIQARTLERKRQHQWERRQPYLVIAASLILCMVMFFWAESFFSG